MARKKGRARQPAASDDLGVKQHVRSLLQRLLASNRARRSAASISEENCQG